MKASRFTDAQKAFIIKQADEGTPVAEICRKAGISCVSAWNKDPVIGVIGVQTGPQ